MENQTNYYDKIEIWISTHLSTFEPKFGNFLSTSRLSQKKGVLIKKICVSGLQAGARRNILSVSPGCRPVPKFTISVPIHPCWVNSVDGIPLIQLLFLPNWKFQSNSRSYERMKKPTYKKCWYTYEQDSINLLPKTSDCDQFGFNFQRSCNSHRKSSFQFFKSRLVCWQCSVIAIKGNFHLESTCCHQVEEEIK